VVADRNGPNFFLYTYIYIFAHIYIGMGDVNNETSPSGQGDHVTSSSIHHVAVKPPIFYKKSPETWFRQMEAQFTLANITKTETKFCHVVSALPEDIACGVLTDECKTYEDIKGAVLTHLKANKHQLIEQALSTMDLGDMRPSQFVAEIKRRFRDIGLTADDAIKVTTAECSSCQSQVRTGWPRRQHA